MSAPPPCAERVFLLWYALIRTNDTHAADFDLSKVLGAHYSTEVKTKQSHDLGGIFQFSMRLPNNPKFKRIKSHGDWVIAFAKAIQATSYVLPARNAEYVAYQIFISGLFAPILPPTMIESLNSTKPSVYERANQKHLLLDSFAALEDLRTISLSAYGMGLNAVEGSSARSGRGNR